MAAKRKIRVLVLDGGDRQALPVSKALRQRGACVTVLCEKRISYGAWSRWPHYREFCPSCEKEPDAYLENLAHTAKFSGGKKLSKTKLIEAMVRAFRETDLDVRGVKDDQELLNRVAAQVR